MKKVLAILLVMIIVVTSVFVCGCMGQSDSLAPSSSQDEGPSKTLLVYCGAGLRDPMEEIAEIFKAREGVGIEYTFGGSAQLLSQIELYQKGDAYMPGARSYIESAMGKGFVDDTEDVVYHVLAIVVSKGNPMNITSVQDLANPGVRVAIGEPSGPAVGKAAKKMLENDGIWEAVEANTVVKSGTVNELLVYISMEQADAAIIWEDLYNSESMELVEIPLKEGFVKVVPIGTLVFSENKENAEKFMQFVASDEGKAIYAKHGFETYPSAKYGDA